MIKLFTKDFIMQGINVALRPRLISFIKLFFPTLFGPVVFAHGVSEVGKVFIEQSNDMQLISFIYLGAT